MSIKEHPPHVHVPVLLEKTLEVLSPQEGENYLDLTAGYGGHARAFFELTKEYRTSVLVDRDEHVTNYLDDFIQLGTRFIGTDFLSAAQQLVDEGKTFDVVLADLGVSSPQLDRAERGFSFMRSGPIDMRMDQRQDVSAEDIVNTYTVSQLTDIIAKYGEESPVVARRIAQAIALARPMHTTEELAKCIEQQHRGRRGKIHPATRTFQALRIEVNNELSQVEQLLPLLPKLLSAGGRVGIISFHSLEDRLVKRYFADQHAAGYEAELILPSKRPYAAVDYDVHNPRSRSAKLRVAVKK